jgi:hypothetical protein
MHVTNGYIHLKRVCVCVCVCVRLARYFVFIIFYGDVRSHAKRHEWTVVQATSQDAVGQTLRNRNCFYHPWTTTTTTKTKHLLLFLQRYLWTITFVLTSVFLIYVACASILSREPCAPGCLDQTYPWFSTDCHCLHAQIDCRHTPLGHGHTHDINSYIQRHFSHAAYLDIVVCPLPQGVSMSTFHTLRALHWLTLNETTTVEWNVLPSDLPKDVYIIELVNQAMPRIPLLLEHPPPSVMTISLDNVTLLDDSELPERPHVYCLYLNNMNWTYIPPTVLTMPVIEKLMMNDNALTTLPDALLHMKTLKFVSVENNVIAEISRIWATMSLRELILDGNPLMAFPDVVPVSWLISGRIQIRRTPLCERILMTNQSYVLSGYEAQVAEETHRICHE